jgi:hypothetical protein
MFPRAMMTLRKRKITNGGAVSVLFPFEPARIDTTPAATASRDNAGGPRYRRQNSITPYARMMNTSNAM